MQSSTVIDIKPKPPLEKTLEKISDLPAHENKRICLNGNNGENQTENSTNESNKVTGIWELHRYCSQKKLEAPWYKIIETTDCQNTKLFTVQCNLKNVQETSSGRRKKEAKHKASYLLLKKLMHNEAYGIDLPNQHDEDSLEEGEINDLEEGEIKDTDSNASTIQDEGEISQTIKFKSCKVYMEGNINKKDCSIASQKKDNKTEIDKLAEFCFEQKLPAPRYEVKEHNGLVHSIFTCKCSVLQLVIRTSGLSMLRAKENASKKLLVKMKQHINILQTDCEDVKTNQIDIEEGEIVDENKAVNENVRKTRKRCKPQMQRIKAKFKFSADNVEEFARSHDLGMGDLYNFCLRLKIPPPVYTMIAKDNCSPTKTIFTFKCSVLKLSRLGKGLNKKQAKHRAARQVLKRLQNWTKTDSNQENEEMELLHGSELTENDALVKKEYIKHKLENNFVSYDQKNSLQLQSITERHDIIKTGKPYTDSIIVKKLKDVDNDFLKRHAIVILNHLCKEIGCTYTFQNLKSSISHMTTVFMNSAPPWSTFGRGDTLTEAKIDSVAKLLIFFKNMTL